MSDTTPVPEEPIALPDPDRSGSTPLEATLEGRRSRREYAPGSLSLSTVGQLLWAAQGRTHPEGFRTAPSAGATYPLELHLVVAEGGVPDLPAGRYRYRPETHDLVFESPEPRQGALEAAAGGQSWLAAAPIDVVIAGREERTAREYGDRAGDLYVPMEAGHAGQNLHLQVEALGLATVTVGGFEDDAVAEAMGLEGARPLAIYPVGRRQSD
jgi:SagB-type dehydrogenase family enzyme